MMLTLSQRELDVLLLLALRAPKSGAEEMWLESVIGRYNQAQAAKTPPSSKGETGNGEPPAAEGTPAAVAP